MIVEKCRPTWNYYDTDTVCLKYERVKILDSHTYPYTELPPLQKWSTSGVENGNQLGDSTDFFAFFKFSSVSFTVNHVTWYAVTL